MASEVTTKRHIFTTVATVEGVRQAVADFKKVAKESDVLTATLNRNWGKIVQTYSSKGLVSEKVYISEQKIAKAMRDTGQAAKGATPHANDMTKALRRAAIVAPIWMAARSAMLAFMGTIRDGVEYINNMDKALARAQAVMHGTSGNVQKVRADVMSMARSLSMETGAPIEKVIEIFYRLGTSGIDASVALGAMPAVLKTAISLMGDAEETAKILAQTYNLLGKSIKGNVTETQKFTILGGTLVSLWQKNQMELGEYLQGLEKAGTTMAQYNIDAGTTMALLATFHQQGIRGAQAGTILARVFDQMAKNSDKLQSSLGITIQKNKTIDWANLLYKTVDKLNTASKSTPENLKKILDIFDIRAAKGERALMLDVGKLKENLDIAKKSYEEMQGKLKELSDLQLQTTDAQINRFKILRNETMLTFIQASTGATTFAEAMINVNNWMLDVIANAATLGVVLRRAFKPTVEETKTESQMLGRDLATLLGLPVVEDNKKAVDDYTKDFWLEVNKSLMENKPNLDQDAQIKIDKLKADIGKLSDPNNTDTTDVVSGLAEKAKIYYEHLQKVAQSLGSGEEELFKTKSLMDSILGITKTENEKLKEKLKSEEAITKEKKKQKGLSEDTLKIYEIGKKYGADVAAQVQGMISGEIDPTAQYTKTGGLVNQRARRLYERQFADKAKQQKAEEYFTTGAGKDIKTPEKLKEEQLANEIWKTNSLLMDELRKSNDKYYKQWKEEHDKLMESYVPVIDEKLFTMPSGYGTIANRKGTTLYSPESMKREDPYEGGLLPNVYPQESTLKPGQGKVKRPGYMEETVDFNSPISKELISEFRAILDEFRKAAYPVIEGEVMLDGNQVGKWFSKQLDDRASLISKSTDKKINNF